MRDTFVPSEYVRDSRSQAGEKLHKLKKNVGTRTNYYKFHPINLGVNFKSFLIITVGKFWSNVSIGARSLTSLK